jgi:hypothetical protein
MPEAPRQTRPGQRGDHHQQTKLLDGENAAGGARHGRRGRATVFREPGGGRDAGSLIWLSGGRGRGLGVSPSPLRLCLPPAVRAHRRLVRGKEKRIWATSTARKWGGWRRARTSCLHLPSMPAADDLARVLQVRLVLPRVFVQFSPDDRLLPIFACWNSLQPLQEMWNLCIQNTEYFGRRMSTILTFSPIDCHQVDYNLNIHVTHAR